MAQVPRAPFVSASFTTQADLSAKQYYAAALSSGLIVSASLSKAQGVVGIVQEKVKGTSTDEKSVQVAISGICRAVVGGNVSENNNLIVDTDGRLIADDAGSQFVVGIALQDGVANDVIAVRLVLAPTLTS